MATETAPVPREGNASGQELMRMVLQHSSVRNWVLIKRLD